MNRAKKHSKFFDDLLIYGVIIFALLVCVVPIVWYGFRVILPEDTTWKERTSPLGSDVVRDLCIKFKVPLDDPLCQNDSQVYAPDFFPIISKAFSLGKATYNDVQFALGAYQTTLEPRVSLPNGDEYYRSWYDLQGDGATALIFFFDQENKLFRILEHYPIDEGD